MKKLTTGLGLAVSGLAPLLASGPVLAEEVVVEKTEVEIKTDALNLKLQSDEVLKGATEKLDGLVALSAQDLVKQVAKEMDSLIRAKNLPLEEEIALSDQVEERLDSLVNRKENVEISDVVDKAFVGALDKALEPFKPKEVVKEAESSVTEGLKEEVKPEIKEEAKPELDTSKEVIAEEQKKEDDKKEESKEEVKDDKKEEVKDSSNLVNDDTSKIESQEQKKNKDSNKTVYVQQKALDDGIGFYFYNKQALLNAYGEDATVVELKEKEAIQKDLMHSTLDDENAKKQEVPEVAESNVVNINEGDPGVRTPSATSPDAAPQAAAGVETKAPEQSQPQAAPQATNQAASPAPAPAQNRGGSGPAVATNLPSTGTKESVLASLTGLVMVLAAGLLLKRKED